MLRREFLKRDIKAGWPDLAACMARAAHSSGVPFATLARTAKAARKALAECGQSTWSNDVGDSDWNNPRNWLYNRLPRPGDVIVFSSCSGNLVETTAHDTMAFNLDPLIVSKCFKGTIGKQGKRL